MATVTMSATLKVDGNNEPIQIGDITTINDSDINNYNLVIFYNDRYYGSEFNCDYFEGVTINFKVRNDKDEQPKLVNTGVVAMDTPPSGNYVRINCDRKSKYYDVSEVASNNTSIISAEDVELMSNNEDEDKENNTRPVELPDSQTTKVSNWSKLRNSLGALKKNKNDDFTNITNAEGGKTSRKAYHKASRKYGRKPSRKAYRKSVANKKRNRGTRKK